MIGARRRTAWPAVAALVLALPAVVLFGILLALAPPLAAFLLLSAVAVVLALVLPLTWMLVGTLVISALLGGSVEYFLRISQANWLPFVLSAVVAARSVLQAQMTPRRPGESAPIPHAGLALFAYPAILYLTILLGSAATNVIPTAQVFTAVKNYVMMWGILVCLLAMGTVERTSTLIWRLIVLISILQLPVVLYQRFFIASNLGNTASSLSYDAINGTFGGGLTGGRSGALAMFICAAWAYVLILWRDRQIRLRWMALLSLLMLPNLFVLEVKVVVFWLPFVALVVFFARIRQRPLLFVLGLLSSVVIATAVIAAYRVSYAAPGGDTSVASFFTRDLAYMYDPDRFNPATRELGRISALVHWWREVDLTSTVNWLVGYGPGASRGSSTVAVGTIAREYPYSIDISAAAALLWDTGVLGLLAFCAILAFGAIEAKRLSRNGALPQAMRHELEAGFIALTLTLSTVFYVRDTIDGSTIQFLTFFLLGVVAHARRQTAIAKSRATVPVQQSAQGARLAKGTMGWP